MREVLVKNSQAQRAAAHLGIMPQCSVECTSPLGELETLLGWVQMRAAPGSTGLQIRRDHPLGEVGVKSGNQSQQLTLGVSLAATDAGPDWANLARLRLLSFNGRHHRR